MLSEKHLIVDSDISLKEIGIGDAGIIFDTIDRERSYLREWLSFVDYTHDISDTRFFIRSVLSPKYRDKEYVAMIYYKNEFAGLIGLKSTDHEKQHIEIGYWLCERFQKLGITTRACQFLIGFVFDLLHADCIQIRVAANNHKSIKIPERLQFTLERIDKSSELLNNSYTDLHVYTMQYQDYLHLQPRIHFKTAS